jgi:DNA-binding SARP family transcriptional activator/pimeloyl-ACP methyl ester carboxylesterase
VEFRVLGPLEVTVAGRPLAIGGPRTRAVLALLLLHANRVVPAETLTGELWPELAPDRGAANLQVRLSELRRALRSVGETERLQTRPPGYVLRVDDAELDVPRFERLMAAGRAALTSGDAADAIRQLTAALRLWRGTPLADIDGGNVVCAARIRLQEEQLSMLETKIDAMLASGRHLETIGELETLTANHPLRERFWKQRLLALYRSGRQAEALRAYRELRSGLVDQLGIEPSPELRELEAGILRQDPTLVHHHDHRTHGGVTFAPTTHYVDNGGVHIAYQVVGDGTLDLLFVPGLMSHVELAWEDPGTRAFYTRLATLGRLILFDKRDTGLSDRSPGDAPLEQRIDDVQAVMDAVSSKHAVVFGYSEGAPMAILFAATFPEKVRGLILGSAFSRWFPAPDYPSGTGAERVCRSMEDIARHRWGQGETIEWFLPSRAHSSDARQAMGRFERMAVSPSTFLRMLRLIREIDVRAALPAIQAPTLVIHRRGDRINPPFHGRYIAEHIPGARYLEYPGDHALRFAEGEDLSAMFAEIEAFVAATDTPEPTRALMTIMLATGIGESDGGAQISAHRGVVRGRAADHVLATFDAPGQAIRCALILQRDASAQTLRVAIHTGEICLRGDQLEGPSLSIAKRLTTYAHDGEILVSRTVKDLLVGSDIAFADRGSQPLTATGDRWALFRVAGTSGPRAAG